MRKLTPITQAQFRKAGETFTPIALPHTWNALDGQDGGNDYWRGIGEYKIDLPDPTPGRRQFIQFEGANHRAVVKCNGHVLGSHEGGFSTFRFELSDCLQPGNNLLEVTVDNSKSDIYPQMADFTFFGGLYRQVTFIETEQAHFDLLQHGSLGVFVTPFSSGHTRIEAFSVQAIGCSVRVELSDGEGRPVAQGEVPAETKTIISLLVAMPHLWQGQADPYLYTAKISLEKDGEIADQVNIRYGYRSFRVDAGQGFFLNGKTYPLHGVCRHQDRQDKGWAISRQDQDDDLDLICEIGANTVRLAHYQHDQYFYDRCDEAGLVIWAEIPFISAYMDSPAARANVISQMTELVLQNYHHPAIAFWGLSNEITVAGESENLYQDLCDLQNLVKKLDPLRLTTMAHLGVVEMTSPHVFISDVLAYNHYFGWYVGEISDNGPWLDAFHQNNPDRPLGISEYGADALVSWHSAHPQNHDYTEEYQALYHEQMLAAFQTRPYLWGTYVWNMFDFAADSRNEGGSRGRNNKGLVTYNRSIRKDAFFIYQAYWQQALMVHLCGRRFTDRAPDERDIKVYTNCRQVTLLVNGQFAGTRAVENHACVFSEVNLQPGDNTVTARTEIGLEDTIVLRGVSQRNPAYQVPPDKTMAGNWFDETTGQKLALEFPDNFYSIKDKVGHLLANPDSAVIVSGLLQSLSSSRAPDDKQPEVSLSSDHMLKMIKDRTLEFLLQMAGQALKPSAIAEINRKLNQIRKEV